MSVACAIDERPMLTGAGGGVLEVLLGLVVTVSAALAALVWGREHEDEAEAGEEE